MLKFKNLLTHDLEPKQRIFKILSWMVIALLIFLGTLSAIYFSTEVREPDTVFLDSDLQNLLRSESDDLKEISPKELKTLLKTPEHILIFLENKSITLKNKEEINKEDEKNASDEYCEEQSNGLNLELKKLLDLAIDLNVLKAERKLVLVADSDTADKMRKYLIKMKISPENILLYTQETEAYQVFYHLREEYKIRSFWLLGKPQATMRYLYYAHHLQLKVKALLFTDYEKPSFFQGFLDFLSEGFNRLDAWWKINVSSLQA